MSVRDRKPWALRNQEVGGKDNMPSRRLGGVVDNVDGCPPGVVPTTLRNDILVGWVAIHARRDCARAALPVLDLGPDSGFTI